MLENFPLILTIEIYDDLMYLLISKYPEDYILYCWDFHKFYYNLKT